MAPEGEPEPTPEHLTPKPEPENEPRGEPGPEWEIAKKTWGAAWEGHWIGMAVLFGILTVFAVFCLRRIYLRKRKQQVMAKFSVTVTSIIAVFTTSRFFYLIINPYESDDCIFGRKNCPLFVNRFLFSIGLPSLLSAYLLLHLALRDVMKLKKISKFTKLQSWWFLCGLVAVNYIFACTADLVVAYHTSTKLFLVLCQGYFIIFSAILVLAFSYSGIRMYLSHEGNKAEILKLSMKHRDPNADKQLRKNGRNFLVKVFRLSIITSVGGVILMALQIYALAFVYAESVAGKTPKPWPWLTYQYAYRLVELALAACILYNISYVPKRKSLKGTNPRNKSMFTSGLKVCGQNDDTVSRDGSAVLTIQSS